MVVVSEEPDFVVTVLILVAGAAVVFGEAESNRRSEHKYFIIMTVRVTFTCFACLCG